MLRLDCDELFFKFLYTRNFHVGPTRNRTNASRFIMKFFNYCCQPLRCQHLRIRKQIMKLKIVSLPHVYLIWQHFTLTRVEPPKTFFWFEIIFYSGTIEAFAWKLTCIILLAAATEQQSIGLVYEIIRQRNDVIDVRFYERIFFITYVYVHVHVSKLG